MSHPFANLGPVIIQALGEISVLSVSRSGAGSYVNGYWAGDAPTVFSVSAVVQPSTPKEILQLPENERTREAITVFCVTPLQTSDVSEALESDVITWAGRTWKVMLVEDWTAQAGYMRAVASRVGE